MIDTIDWEIMNSTADDWESIEQIFPSTKNCDGVTKELISQRIIKLVNEGMLEEMNGNLPAPASIIEYPKKFWFGMTKVGRQIWENEAARFYTE